MAKIRYQFGIINTPLDMKTKFKVILNSCNDLHQYHEFNNLSNTGWHIHGLLFRNLVHHHAWVMQGHVFCTSPCLFMLLCTNILSYYFPRYSYGCNSHSWYFINPIPLLMNLKEIPLCPSRDMPTFLKWASWCQSSDPVWTSCLPSAPYVQIELQNLMFVLLNGCLMLEVTPGKGEMDRDNLTPFDGKGRTQISFCYCICI